MLFKTKNRIWKRQKAFFHIKLKLIQNHIFFRIKSPLNDEREPKGQSFPSFTVLEATKSVNFMTKKRSSLAEVNEENYWVRVISCTTLRLFYDFRCQENREEENPKLRQFHRPIDMMIRLFLPLYHGWLNFNEFHVRLRAAPTEMCSSSSSSSRCAQANCEMPTICNLICSRAESNFSIANELFLFSPSELS